MKVLIFTLWNFDAELYFRPNSSIISILKTCNGWKHEPDSNKWSIPQNQVAKLTEKLRKANIEVVVEEMDIAKVLQTWCV
jgi:hypothetical protein